MTMETSTPNQLNYSIQHQKVALSLNLDDGMVKGSIKLTIKPLNSNLSKIFLNARDLEIINVKFNEEIKIIQKKANESEEVIEGEGDGYVYHKLPKSLSEIINQNIVKEKVQEDQSPSSSSSTSINVNEDLKYSNKWLRTLNKSSQRELEISVPNSLIIKLEVPIITNQLNLNAENLSKETATATVTSTETTSNEETRSKEDTNNTVNVKEITSTVPIQLPPKTVPVPIETFQNIILTIDYIINPSKLNFGSISLYKARRNPKNQIRYIQLIGNAFNGMARYLMPCADLPGERLANWDLEYSVIAGSWQDVFDRIHLVSSGVLCRQFVNDEKTIKVFHYKIQDIPCAANQISFIAGAFDAVKIPNVPFAYAFSPIGKSSKLANCMEFLGKAFNFYNWYLNSSSGNLKSLASLSSEVFPFPSYYLIFVKDLPKNFISTANMTIFSSDLLCESTEIDQSLETRRILCRALAEQYFSLRIDLKTPHDSWILKGIIGYLTEIQLKTFHGNNDYRLKIKKDIERLVSLENTENLYVPPLATIAGYLQEQQGKLNPLDRTNLEEILELKSRLIFILLEKKIERNFLQKLLSHIYAETLINRHRDGFSCQLFLKLIKRLTGKDLKSFTDQWIFNSGCPMFSLSFFHNRKRSIIEFEMAALRRLGSFKFSGNLTIRIVEAEMIFHEHVVHIDESTSKFDVPFHSKAKKPRKKKVFPTTNASTSTSNNTESIDSQDEDNNENPGDDNKKSVNFAKLPVEEDESLNETLVSPISWIRIDPEMEWLAQFSLAQPDIMWIEALENDRDVVAQWEAVKALPLVSFTSESACFALERFINDWKAFWAVRVEAINSMALIGASLQDSPVRLLGARKLFEIFNKKFGHPNPSLLAYPKANSFEILPNYFLQCAIPCGMSLAISAAFENSLNGQCDFGPLEPFITFFADVLKYNDNSANNGYSDGEYLAILIKCGTSVFARIQNEEAVMMRFRSQLDDFVSQLNRYARLELILPTFKNVVMSAVLESCTVIPSSLTDLLSPRNLEICLEPLNHVQVRLDAFRFFSVHFREISHSTADAFNLLQFVCSDSSVEFRRKSISDVATFELLQFLLHSMDENCEIDLKEWLKTEFTSDHLVLSSLLSAISVLEGSSSSDESQPTTTTQANVPPTKLKITLNLVGAERNNVESPPQTTPAIISTPSVDDEDDIWLRELTGDGNKLGVIGTGTTPSNSDEREILNRVWQVIWSNYDSIPFRYPVDYSVPGYYAIIKYPMDLSTIRDRISSLNNFLMDLRLVFQNCFTFNQPESLIYDQAKRLRTLAINELKGAFPREKKLIKRYLKTAQEDINLLQTIDRAIGISIKRKPEVPDSIGDDDVFGVKPLNVNSTSHPIVPKIAIKIPTIVQDLSRISASDCVKLKNILQKLCKHRHAYFFLEPVDPIALNIPTYFDIIKTPMDFSTIKSKLSNYSDVEEFAVDCRLIFSNCKTFNSPETLVYQVAVELENLFESDWMKFKLPSSPKKQTTTTTTTVSTVNEIPKIKLSLNLSSFKK